MSASVAETGHIRETDAAQNVVDLRTKSTKIAEEFANGIGKDDCCFFYAT